MDVTKFLADFSAGDPATKMRLGQARVRSVDTDPVYTLTTGQAVIVPTSQEWGTSEIVANYLGEYPPRPGGSCWYVTDGVDRIILGMMAPDGPPACKLDQSAASTATTGVAKVVSYDTQNMDPWNMYSATDSQGSANGCMIIPADGLYDVNAYAVWAANSTGYRQIAVRRDTGVLQFSRVAAVTTAAYQSLTVPAVEFTKGQFVSAICTQNSGGSLEITSSSISAVYVGRRRSTSGTATLIADGDFENNDITSSQSAWDFTNATSATWSLDPSFTGHYDGAVALKGVHAAGTVSTVVQSNTVIPVVPRQKLRLSAYVQANALMPASATVGAQFLLLTSADGTPEYLQTGTTASTAGTSLFTTSFLPISQDVTVPTGAFVARIGLRTMSTSANTVNWDAIVATEIIS